MPQNKTYEIKTVQDIFEIVTTENIDRFMIDFYAVFDSIAKAKETLPTGAITMPSYEWIDDGEHNLDFRINGKMLDES